VGGTVPPTAKSGGTRTPPPIVSPTFYAICVPLTLLWLFWFSKCRSGHYS